MNEQNYSVNQTTSIEDTVQENVLAGAIGAFLFSLAGGIIWFVLYQINLLAGISGIVGVICAIRGYSLFSKKESLKGVIIAIIMSAVVILIAWYLCLAMDVHALYATWFAEGGIDYQITFPEAVRGAYIFLGEPEVAAEYLRDLLIGLVLCGVGSIHSIKNAITRAKASESTQTSDEQSVNSDEQEKQSTTQD